MDLHGASADSLSALTSELDAAVSGSGDGGHDGGHDGAARVGRDLFLAATTLRSQSALRRFVTDGSVPAEVKQGLTGEVFGGSVSTGAAELLAAAVARRWTAGRDLADVLEHLSVLAHVRSAGHDSNRLVDEIFGLGRLVAENPDLRDALSDPARSPEDKGALLEALLADKALPSTVALAKQSLSGSYRTVSAALTAYERVAADAVGESVATVRAARALTDSESERLSAALSAQYGRPIHLNLLLDPSVLGGLRVEIGDDVIDGTVSSRLDEARRTIAG